MTFMNVAAKRRTVRSRLLLSATSALALFSAAAPILAQSIVAEGAVNPTAPAGSAWTADNIRIGDGAAGSVTASGGATIEAISTTIGNGADGSGMLVLTGDGTTLENSFGLYVGYLGEGELQILDGAKAFTGSMVVLGDQEGAFGRLIVSGPGSALQAAPGAVGRPNLWIGERYGAGEMRIDLGGVVQTGTSIIDTGSVGVDGVGSLWDTGYLSLIDDDSALSITAGGRVTANSMTIGDYGVASVSVDGTTSRLESEGVVVIGYADQSSGRLTLSNGAIADFGDYLSVGEFGSGDLVIESGAALSSGSGYLGFEGQANGTASVIGEGSRWDAAQFVLGSYDDSQGTLIVSDGGVASAGSNGDFLLGYLDRAAGTIVVGAAAGEAARRAGAIEGARLVFGEGHARLVFNHTGNLDGSNHVFSPIVVGSGTIDHLAGRTVLAGSNTDVDAFTGTMNITGGSVSVDGVFGGTADNRAMVNVGSGAILGGTGTIAGHVALSAGGVLAGAQDQTLTIEGNLGLSSASSVDVALGGGSLAPALFDIGGNLVLDGTLNVADAGGFATGIYRIFDYGGTLIDNGLTIGIAPTGVGAENLSIQTAVANRINLVAASGVDLGFWDGDDISLHGNGQVDGGAGTWSADRDNWTDETGMVVGPFRPNRTFAVFQGTGGEVTVDGSAGAIGVTGMQFAADGYRIVGDTIALQNAGGQTIIRVGDGTAAGADMTATIAAQLTGDTELILNDLGTLVLSGTNTYGGDTRIMEGVLSVSADANLGAASRDVVIGNGSMRVTGTGFEEMRRRVALSSAGSGIDVAEAAHTFTLSGIVEGDGGLLKRGAGTLALTGTNTYAGPTQIEQGTLVGTASSIRGDIRNGAIAVFDQIADATFSGNVLAYFGGVPGEMIKRGGGALTLAGTSTLNWSVEDGTLVSASNRFGGDLDIAAGAGFIFDQGYGGEYGGALSGAGEFAFRGGGTVALTGDNSGFAGLSTITNSTLVVDRTLGGSALIGAGGRLAGTGTIGSGSGSQVTLSSGGTLAPGNSIGTLTVDGDLTFAAGSRFEVEVAPGGTESDLVAVTGTARIDGGTVAHIGMTGAYDPAATYTILSAAGGIVSGSAFDAVTSDFAFLDTMLGYGANDITLTLTRNDTGFADVGVTRNQRATARGLDSLAPGDELYDAVIQLDRTTAREAFDQLSGEIHGSVVTGLAEDSRHIRNAVNDRTRAAFGNVGASSTPVLSYGPNGPILTPAEGAHPGMSVWGTTYGAWGSTNGDGNAAPIDRSTAGLLIGADTLVADQVRLGVLAGFSHSSVDLDARASAANIDSYHLGLYGGAQWDVPNGTLAVRGGLAHSWHDIDTSRSVGFIGFADSPTANYDASTFQAFGELGYGIDTEIGRFEPFINLAHVAVGTGRFGESGGAAALSGAGGSAGITFATVGVRAETAIDLGQASARLNGMIGWQHAFGETTPTSTHAFAGSEAFTLAGAPIGRDALVLGAGLTLDLTPDATLGLSYQGHASGVEDHGFKANLAVRF